MHREARLVGLQADSTFHPQSQSGKKKKKNPESRGRKLAHVVRTVALCDLWKCHFAWLNRRSCESAPTAAEMLALAERVSFYFDIGVCAWLHATQTPHRPTADIMLPWSKARLTESVSSERGGELKWWANSCDTATKAAFIFLLYWWFSAAGWVVSAAFTQRRSNDGALMPGSAVTHYFATTASLKVCMQAVTAFKSFHLPVCLHHPLAHHTHCTWQEMNRGQPCISFKSHSICVCSLAICIAYAFLSGSNLPAPPLIDFAANSKSKLKTVWKQMALFQYFVPPHLLSSPSTFILTCKLLSAWERP